MGKRNILLVLLAAALFLPSCKKGESDSTTAQQPVRVKTMAASVTDINTSRVYSGTIEESTGTSLSFPVSGTLQTLSVSAGDHVRAGQLIATLDQSSLRNAYDITKATLDEAQDAYDRMKMLHDSNSLPDMQWVEVQNTLKQAKSAEAIAAKALKDAYLYAPVSGYVSESFVQAGMTVAPIEPIVKIVTINPVKVNISMPENEISTVSDGQTANVNVGALNQAYIGKVTEKGVSANPISRAYEVKITVANPNSQLLPGMLCDVTLDNAVGRQAVVLPMSAVLLDADNQNFVWLSSKGHATKRLVQVAGIVDDGIEISSGIADGDSIIVEGQQKVSEQTPVISIN